MGATLAVSKKFVESGRATYCLLDEYVQGDNEVRLLGLESGSRYYVIESTPFTSVRRPFSTLLRARTVYEDKVRKLSLGPVADSTDSTELYQPISTLHFLLTESKTIAIIHPNSHLRQTFLIGYDHRNHMKQLKQLREMIKQNKITSIVDLVEFCDFRTGNYRNQTAGLEMIPTKLERYIYV